MADNYVTTEICDIKHKQIMEEFKTIKEDVADVKKDIEEVKINIAELPEKLAEKFDERYAGKLSERLVFGLAGVMLAALIYALLNNVIK